jgi:hypothetical protein
VQRVRRLRHVRARPVRVGTGDRAALYRKPKGSVAADRSVQQQFDGSLEISGHPEVLAQQQPHSAAVTARRSQSAA